MDGVDIGNQRCIFIVGVVVWHVLVKEIPRRVRHLAILAQVGEGHDVTGVAGSGRLIRHPYFHAVNLHTGGQVGQGRHGLVVVLTEIAGEEEVAVLLVVGSINLEGCCLCAAFRGDALRGRLLLRQHRLQLQLAELHVGTDAEKAAGTLHQRVVRGEGDVAGLDELDNLVLLAVVLQLQVLCVEVEGGVGVVVEVEVHLVADLGIGTEVDFLVEVEARGLTVTDRQRGVVDVLQRSTHLQLGRSLCLHTHTARAKDFLCGT